MAGTPTGLHHWWENSVDSEYLLPAAIARERWRDHFDEVVTAFFDRPGPFRKMKLIPLTQGKCAIVDDADYGWISQFKWHAEKVGKSRTFYAAMGWGRGATRRTIRMHQLICPDASEVDHTDRNGLNNSRKNLRAATKSQNAGNMAKWESTKCTSRFKGVCRINRKKRPWLARAGNKHAGVFATEIEAAHAYDKAALEVFGGFARLNFPADSNPAALGQH